MFGQIADALAKLLTERTINDKSSVIPEIRGGACAECPYNLGMIKTLVCPCITCGKLKDGMWGRKNRK